MLKIYAQCAQDLSTMCWTQYCHRFRFYEAYASSKCSAHSACSLASSKCSACAAHSTSARRRKPYPARFRDRCASATDRDLATFSGVAGHRNVQIMDNTDLVSCKDYGRFSKVLDCIVLRVRYTQVFVDSAPLCSVFVFMPYLGDYLPGSQNPPCTTKK